MEYRVWLRVWGRRLALTAAGMRELWISVGMGSEGRERGENAELELGRHSSGNITV